MQTQCREPEHVADGEAETHGLMTLFSYFCRKLVDIMLNVIYFELLPKFKIV